MTYANVTETGLGMTVASSLVDPSNTALVREINIAMMFVNLNLVHFGFSFYDLNFFPRLPQFFTSFCLLSYWFIYLFLHPSLILFTIALLLDHGRCVALYKCDCNAGWTGVSCALPDCAGVNQCSGQGECVSSNTCRCYPGFQGANCSDLVSCANLDNCNGNGVCMQEENDVNLTCR